MKMRISRSAVLHTVAVKWEKSPEGLVNALCDFVNKMVHEHSALLQQHPDSQSPSWVPRNEAESRIEEQRVIWQKLADVRSSTLVKRNMNPVNGNIFLFTKESELRSLLNSLKDSSDRYYLGLYIDWSHPILPERVRKISTDANVEPIILLQLMLFNFQPSFASPEPVESQITEIDEAELLKWFGNACDLIVQLYKKLEDLQLVPMNFRIMGDWMLPMFFYFEPEFESRTDNFDTESYFNDLVIHHYISSIVGNELLLNVPRIPSPQVSGCIVSDKLIALRRDIEEESREGCKIRANYVLLPSTKVSRREIDKLVRDFAHSWSIIELIGGLKADSELRKIEYLYPRIKRWRSSVNMISRSAKTLQLMLPLANNREERKRIFRLNRKLRSILSRMETEILQASTEIVAADAGIHVAAEEAKHVAERSFSMRPIPGVFWILDEVMRFFPFPRSREETLYLTRLSQELREIEERSERAIHEVFMEQEQEEKEYQAGKQSRFNSYVQFFGLVVAVIASFQVLYLSWNQDNQAGTSTEYYTQPFANFLMDKLWDLRVPQLSALSILLIALFSLTFLSVRVAYNSFARIKKVSIWLFSSNSIAKLKSISERIKKAEKRWDKEDEYDQKERECLIRIAQIWNKNSEAQSTLSSKNLTQSDRLSKVNELDEEACQQLIEVIEFIFLLSTNDTVNHIDDLERNIRREVVESYLLDQRPERIVLLRVLCLLKYQLDYQIVSIIELEQTADLYGYSKEEIINIENFCEANRDCSPNDFLKKLKEFLETLRAKKIYK